jgi:hypothetical protein
VSFTGVSINLLEGLQELKEFFGVFDGKKLVNIFLSWSYIKVV